MTWKIQKVNDPWPYMVIDNFVSEEDFKDMCEDQDPFLIRQTTPITEEFLHEHFPVHRKYYPGKWEYICEFQTTDPHTEYPVHDEAERKVLSCIHYISPEENVGTDIYDKDKNYVTTVEWKPNRAIIFAAQSGLTWHGYKNNTDHPRITANTFFAVTGSRPV